MTKRIPKSRTASSNPVTLAFAFESLENPQYTVTRVAWQSEAKGLLGVLNESLKAQRELPIRDLRLRLQVRDAGVIRVDRNLGRWGGSTLLVSSSSETVAARAANAAVAEWVKEMVLTLAVVNQTAGQRLRELALAGEAVEAKEQVLAVFKWEQNQQTNSVKASDTIRTQYADLADFVASKLAGQEVFPEAGPMRLEVSSDLTLNEARLLSDPIEVLLPTGKTALFSLGLTVSVETYPGRPLPVVHIEHRKSVWAREPSNKYEKLSGFALPAGEARALRFEIERNALLTVQYQAIARQYDLPLADPITREPITAIDLGINGSAGLAFEACPVVITHRHGQGEKNTVGRGVTDLDRQLSFEQLTDLLAPAGFFPWQTLEEIPTHYKAQQDSDSGWRHTPAEEDEQGLLEPDERYVAWVQKTRDGLQAHYNGAYHFVIAYYNGLQQHAVRARDILWDVLGKESLVIHLLALPEGVHGSRRTLPANDARPPERAHQREQAWAPAVAAIRAHAQQHEHNPVRGVLVLADKWYEKFPDDSVNKQAARITLNRELGVVVQYLLPMEKKLDGTSNARQLESFRMRVVNAWRDMAWKSLGTMHGLDLKLERSLQNRPVGAAVPVILGLGVIRTNRTGQLQNDASFIPYVIELHPETGKCQASLLLQSGNATPVATPMQDLTQTIQLLTINGPSYLIHKGTDTSIREERKRLTQQFLYETLVERTQLHPEVLVLADSVTLKGVWPWLADERLDPRNIIFNQENHAEQDFPNATFVRIRQDHAPKVIMDTPQTRVKIAGQVRPSARRSDADLFRLTNTSPTLPSYYSFGSRIFKPVGGTSVYRPILNVNEKTGEEKLQAPWTDTWLTPNAVEITVAQHPQRQRFHPDDVARLVEALRSEYGHYGSWTNAPGPLHFASFLKEYVPDYELEEYSSDSKDS
jgi:hypothetical protein